MNMNVLQDTGNSALIWAVTLIIILTIGEPDLLTAIIHYLMK